MSKYAIGLDFGTLSVRALLVDIQTGEEVATSVFEYPHGAMESKIPTGERVPLNGSLQEPRDYVEGLVHVIPDVLKISGVSPESIVGIGVDFTSSTILPVMSDGTPLCHMEEFRREPHAYVKLWKHHGGEKEAEYMDSIAKERKEEWMFYYGGKVSAEWMMPKVLETLNHAPAVYETADRFMEAMDWIVWQMTGQETRSINGLRYKAFYNHKTDYPSKAFYKAVNPRMEHYIDEKMEAPIRLLGETAGVLSDEMARKTGLSAGTPVGTPIIDSHACMLGGGVCKPNEMMIVVGTSFCHLMMSEKEEDVVGVCSMAKDGVIPGYFAYEAGQSAGGDQLAWFTANCVPESYEMEARERGMNIHQLLCAKLEGYQAGQSGLLALDWFNGVRSPLADFDLNGLIMGMNLQTKPEEIYMALIEATGFGTRMIVEEFEKAGIAVHTIELSGGIPMKNPMFVQVYADILNRRITVCDTAQSGAMGAAILGVAAAPADVTGYHSLGEITEKLGKKGNQVYHPNPINREAYDKLYEEYNTLTEYFGKGMNNVMKRLNRMREER